MDGFSTLNVGGRIIHLAEPWNQDGEDVVLWAEHNDQADDASPSPLDLAIAGEGTTSEETDEAENEDPVMDEEEFWGSFSDPYVAWNSWSEDFADDGKWYGAIACADGETIIPGEKTSWDEDGYEATDAFEAQLTQPIEGEEHVNGHELAVMKVGLWREANLDVKRFTARHSMSPHGYNTYRRKDLIRVEPIRKARRNNRMN